MGGYLGHAGGNVWKDLPVLGAVEDPAQFDLEPWAAQRRAAWPDDPYKAGFCVLRSLWEHDLPGAGLPHVEIVGATPQALINSEALIAAHLGNASPDISLATNQAHLIELAADLEHRRLCVDRVTGEHRAACTWPWPATRSTHSAHCCDGADVCWHGAYLKIDARNRRAVYKIADYRQDDRAWAAHWCD